MSFDAGVRFDTPFGFFRFSINHIMKLVLR
jgi:hypothetical protein